MTRRSRAREVALQLLFQFDHNPKVARPVLEQFTRERLSDADLERFCLGLYDGVRSNREQIDRKLTEVAENWRLPRMAAVDRNVLRMGAYELLHAGVPATAAINEAIELARRYGSKDSPGFVNGLLDRISRQGDAPPAPDTPAAAPADPASPPAEGI